VCVCVWCGVVCVYVVCVCVCVCVCVDKKKYSELRVRTFSSELQTDTLPFSSCLVFPLPQQKKLRCGTVFGARRKELGKWYVVKHNCVT